MTTDRPHVHLVMASPHMWRTYGVFNPNFFPKHVEDKVNACSTRMALCLLFREQVIEGMGRSQRDFFLSLEKYREDAERAFRGKSGGPKHVAYSDGLRYTAVLYSYLNGIKSFLDVYAGLMGKTIGPNLSWTFKRGKVSGVDLAGGKLIRWLRQSAPASLVSAESLAKVAEGHAEKWINRLVKYRDDLSHYNDLKGFQHMQLPVHFDSPCFREYEVVGPAMPDGQSLESYCEDTLANLSKFVRESIVLLPNIDPSRMEIRGFPN